VQLSRYEKIDQYMPHVIFVVLLFGLIAIFINILAPKFSLYNMLRLDQVIWIKYRFLTIRISLFISLIFMLFSKTSQEYVIKTFLSFSVWIRCLLILLFSLMILSDVFKSVIVFSSIVQSSIDFTSFIFILFLGKYFRKNLQVSIYILIYTVAILSILYFIFIFVAMHDVNSYTGLVHDDILTHARAELFWRYNFTNPRFLDHFITWFLPIMAIPLLLENQKRHLKVLCLLAMTILCFLIIAHGCRAFIFEYLFIFSIMIVFMPKNAIKFFVYMSLAFILGYILFYLIFAWPFSDNGLLTNKGVLGKSLLTRALMRSSDRIDVWSLCVWLATQNPLLGIGKLTLPMYTIPNQWIAHNIIFEIMSDFGFISLFIFILILSRFVSSWMTIVKSKKDDIIFFAVSSSVIAGLTHALMSNIFKEALGRYSTIFIFGLLVSLCLNHNSLNVAKSCFRVKRTILVLIILSLVSIYFIHHFSNIFVGI